MLSTADLISGFVARRSTRKVNNWPVSCDSSFATSAFSVITGDLIMSQTVRMFTPSPSYAWAQPSQASLQSFASASVSLLQQALLQLFLPLQPRRHFRSSATEVARVP